MKTILFGIVSLTYTVFRRKILNVRLPIFITDRCNSKCLICNIWKKEPKTDLDVEIIKEILRDKVITNFTSFLIAGGEPMLHPKCREILSLFQGRNYLFLSNGILADRLIDLVREFRIKSLALSLDGPPETYEKMRGVDCYSHVEKVVDELKSDDVDIYVNFVISPWNTREDFKHVIEFCKKHGVYLQSGYYENMEYFDTTTPAGKLYNITDLLSCPPLQSKPHRYFDLYHDWISGSLKIPCFSVLLRPVIRPNGDVELCEGKATKLGNLYEQSLGEIWHSKRTAELQRRYIRCNACWADGQRPMDVRISSLLKTFIPSRLLNRFFGKCDWNKIPLLSIR
ncbi:MAG: radical SAM protein [Candidatus Bathyarchaeota archaeon]|nr:radical SAM protein [Candidatus Bathyarchaeota archaeon]MDH5787720.1 radical SAM protein [Candidatus Bathyarchaeota archaeon]